MPFIYYSELHSYFERASKNLKRKQLWLVTSDQSSGRAVWSELDQLWPSHKPQTDSERELEQGIKSLSFWVGDIYQKVHDPSLLISLHLHVSIRALKPVSVCGGSHCSLWEVCPGEPPTTEHAEECMCLSTAFKPHIKFMNDNIFLEKIIQSFTAKLNAILISFWMCYYKIS